MREYIYLAGSRWAENPIHKVGRSIDPETRMTTQRVPGQWFRPELIWFWPVENASRVEFLVHDRLKPHLAPGRHREWFSVSADDALAAIKAVIYERNARTLHAWYDVLLTAAQVEERTSVPVRTLYRLFGPRGTPHFGKVK